MAQVWVRAKTILNVEENGKRKQYHPGDWCKMGRHQAREFLRRDQIEILKSAILQTVQDLTDCAILLRGVLPEPRLSYLAAKFPGVPTNNYEGYPDDRGRFLIWDTSAELRHDLILTGFHLLGKWQLAVPLLDYNTLASDIGTDEDRAETKRVIHDLRVPVYDTRILFVRQCRETRSLFELWNEGDDLAFLRALYQSRPVINALPPSWVLE